MLTSEITTNDLANHYRAVRKRLMGKSNVLPFPSRKTNPEPSSVKAGAIQPIPPIKVIYDFQPLPFVPSAVANLGPAAAPPSRRITVDHIRQVVCRHYSVGVNDIISNRRDVRTTWPRQVAMYLARNLTPQSLPYIGKKFGGRDHTTVMHAVRKVSDAMADDTHLASELAILEHKIKNGEG